MIELEEKANGRKPGWLKKVKATEARSEAIYLLADDKRTTSAYYKRQNKECEVRWLSCV